MDSLIALLKDLGETWDSLRGMGIYPEVLIFTFGVLIYTKWYKRIDARKASPVVFIAGIFGNIVYSKYQQLTMPISWIILMGINIGFVSLALHYVLRKYKILDKMFGEETKDDSDSKDSK